MPDNAKGIISLLKEWGDWLMFLLPFVIYGLWKSILSIITAYRTTHTSAYKIAAIEKVLKESLVTKEACEVHHRSCQDRHELRFSLGTQELDILKGQGEKTEAHFIRLEEEMKKLMADNQAALIATIQKEYKEKK